MKEVIFKNVSIKNFLSIGDEPVDIKIEPGIHIITGVNKDKEDSKNGVGKSTVSDAIFFAIFGTTLRPIKKEVITNWINKKECSVTITFDVINDGKVDSYILLRSLNPSRVQLIKDGEDISRTIGKTNENIFEILGTTPEMFEQSAIMCLNQVEPFLAKTPAVKRKFIEDIFKIEIFGRMAQFMRSDYNETKKQCDFENERLSDVNDNIALYKKQQLEQEEKKKLRITELKTREQDAIDKITNTKARLSEIKINSSDKTDISEKISKIKIKEKEISEKEKEHIKLLTINQTTILNIKSKIKEVEKTTDGICPYCKQPYSESNIQEKLKIIKQLNDEKIGCEDIVKQAQANIDQIQKAKNTLEDLKDEWDQKRILFERSENELLRIKSELTQQEKWLAQIIKDIQNAENDNSSFDVLIKESTDKFILIENIIKEYVKKIEVIESSRFIVSDEGVKNIIIKKMIKMLNGRLNYYLKRLDANCTCQFNEYFDETIVNNRGRECSYFNFSGGERKRIDLAMLFTFMDIRRMQSNISINIRLYDELLDTSLDSIGIEKVLDVLKDRSINNNEAIYIISHKNEAAKHATGEIIYLEKENDITRRKPYDSTFNECIL